MAVFPAIYRARAMQVNGAGLQAYVPQVFGESPIPITAYMGEPPTTPGMGWVMFQGGNPEFPVWLGVSVGGDSGGPGVFVTRDYRWQNIVTATDPGHGFVKVNNLDPALATFVYMSLYDRDDNAYITATTLQPGDLISVYLSGDINTRIEYALSAPLTNNGNVWLTLPVTLSNNQGFQSGTPGNNVSVKVVVQVTGHAAPIQPMPGGSAGDVILKNTSTPGDASWTKTIPNLTVTNLTAGTIVGAATATTLRATSSTELDLASTAHGLQIGPSAGINLAADMDEIQARNNGAVSTLSLNPHGGTIQLGGGGTPAQQVRIGDDTYFTDINVANTLALVGVADGTQGNLKMGGATFRGLPTYWQLSAPAAGNGYLDGDAQYFRNSAGGVQMSLGGGLLSFPTGAECIRFSAASAYQTWYNGGTRIGYLQGNSGQIYLNAEAAGVSLRLRGAAGCYLDNGVANYQVSESVVGGRVVCTDSNGYIFGNYINMTADTGGDVPVFAGRNSGENYMRWFNTVNANKITWNSAVTASLNAVIVDRDSYDPDTKSWGYSQYRAHGASGRPASVAQIAFWVPYGNAAPMVGAFVASGETIRCVNSANTAHIPVYASAFTVISSRRSSKEKIVALKTDDVLERMGRVPLFSFRRKIPPQRLRLREGVEPQYNEDGVIINSEAEDWDSCDHDCAIDPCVGTHKEDDPCPEMQAANRHIGFMADDLGKEFPELAPHDEERSPGAIDVGQVAMVAFAGVGALLDRVQALATKVEALERGGSGHGAE